MSTFPNTCFILTGNLKKNNNWIEITRVFINIINLCSVNNIVLLNEPINAVSYLTQISMKFCILSFG